MGATRIGRERRAAILAAGLGVFARAGYEGATLDAVAAAAGLSKPNLLYYFPSKAAVYRAILDGLLDDWLAPLRALDPEGEPLAQMLAYVRAKLVLSREAPAASRLFAGEVLRGAPALEGGFADLRALVDDRARVIGHWMEGGALAPSDPHHLVMSIWALTQHYADFEVQVRAVLGPGRDPWAEAEREVLRHFERVLAPR